MYDFASLNGVWFILCVWDKGRPRLCFCNSKAIFFIRYPWKTFYFKIKPWNYLYYDKNVFQDKVSLFSTLCEKCIFKQCYNPKGRNVSYLK